MDDLSINDARLLRALDELRQVNRWLGGHANSLRAIASVTRSGPLRLLDVGAGGGDFLVALGRWSRRKQVPIEATGVELNPETVAYAAERLGASLPAEDRQRFHVQQGDAFALPFREGTFDVAHAALFLHHFGDEEIVRLLCEMRRVARVVVVNDLHRHPGAYYSIDLVGRVLRASAMFRADAPHSVLRAFTRAELHALAQRAGLTAHIRWRWAFRWILVAS